MTSLYLNLDFEISCFGPMHPHIINRPTWECLEVPLLLQLEDGPADLLLEVAALLHGHGKRLLGEWLANLSEVAVLVELVPDLKWKQQHISLGIFPNFKWQKLSLFEYFPRFSTIWTHFWKELPYQKLTIFVESSPFILGSILSIADFVSL